MIVGIDLVNTSLKKNTDILGILQEDELTKKLGWFIIESLNRLGHRVVNCTNDEKDENLYDKVYIANKYPLDLFLSINLQIEEKSSVETYVFRLDGIANEIANSIRKNINLKCGLQDSGNHLANYYILEHTKAPAVILNLFILKADENTICESIAKAIVEMLLNCVKKEDKPLKDDFNVYIQTKVYNTDEIDGIKLDNIMKIFGEYRVYVKSFYNGVFFETQYMNMEEANNIRERLGDKFLHYCFK